jgi:hypothetical protein
MAATRQHVQAFVELRSEDPEAASAHAVARERLASGGSLVGLRRFRLFEISGAALDRAALAARLHTSTQFYNPAKERCVLRAGADEPLPVEGDEALVLVFERGGERRAAAERWWRHEAGERVQVREGVVWALRFEAGADACALAGELAEARDRAHGLLANPHFQECRVCAGQSPPLDWMSRKSTRKPRRPGRPA